MGFQALKKPDVQKEYTLMQDKAPLPNFAEIDGNSVYPAFGVETAIQLDQDATKQRNREIVDMTAETARFDANAALTAGQVVRINAGDLGHTPDGRGRRTGDGNIFWRDYCNTTSGKICYGPYHDLDPGVYVFYYDLSFRIPVCGGANDSWVFTMDTTQDIGQPIPGSKLWFLKWKFMCDKANEDNVFEGEWGGRFAIAEKVKQVEMRLGNSLTQLAGLPFEILVRRLIYWKEN